MASSTAVSAAPAYKIVDHSYDVVVVGAGGSGLRATMGAAERKGGGSRRRRFRGAEAAATQPCNLSLFPGSDLR